MYAIWKRFLTKLQIVNILAFSPRRFSQVTASLPPRSGAFVAKNFMNKEEKVKAFIINSGIFNVTALCEKTAIDRLHMHRWLTGTKKIHESEIEKLVILLKKYGFK